jgi:hypothetical protein
LSVTLAAALGILPAAPAHAVGPIVVTNLDDGGAGSLRDAINQANNEATNPGPDTITFQAGLTGRITLQSSLPTIAYDTTINGPGQDVVSISGNVGGEGPAVTPIHIAGAPGTINVNINNLKVELGFDGDITSTNANLTLDHTTITGATGATQGGGVYFKGAGSSNLTISNSTITGNDATFDGGGVAIHELTGSATITGTTISGNTAGLRGAGIYMGLAAPDTHAHILGSTISGNSLSGGGSQGGGIDILGENFSGDTLIQNSTVSGNSAGQNGGGVWAGYLGGLSVVQSTVSGNSAQNGAGINLYRATGTVLENTTLSGNTASVAGGGLNNQSTGGAHTDVTVNVSTIAKNSASNGGGIAQGDPGGGSITTTLSNSIVGDNTAGTNPDVDNGLGTVNASFSIIENLGTATVGGSSMNVDPKLNDLATDPSAPSAPQTQKPQPTSPAINAGDPAFTTPTVDERGKPRPSGGAVDLGAVELQNAAPAAPDLQAASDTGSSPTDNITKINKPTFDVTGVDPSATVTLLRNHQPTGATRVGNGPIQDPTAQADGIYTYTLTTTGTDGPSPESTGLAVTIDTTAPATPAAPDLQDASDTGASNTDNITKATSRAFTIAGIESGATATLLRNGVSVGTLVGNGTITDSTAAADGTLTYTVTATDVAGNVSGPSAALPVTLDTTVAPPAAPDLQAGSDSGSSNTDNLTNATSRTFDLTGAETGATVNLLRNGTIVGSRSGNGSVTDSTAATDGVLTYTVTQTDLAGNTSGPSPALAVTLDTTAPAQPGAPVLTNGTVGNATNSTSPSFTTNVAGNTVVLLRNGTVVASSPSGGAITDPGPVASGTYSYTVQAVDAAGNTSQASPATSVVVSATATSPGPTPPSNSTGYWLVATDGGVFSYGGAQFFGSTGNITLNKPIVGMAATPTRQGYWMVATDGGIFAFGDAKFFGSTGSIKLVKPILAMEPTPSGKGYWLLASDGGLFAYGDAQFFGSATNVAANNPAVAMAATPTGKGYIIVLADGTVVAFGDAQSKGGLNGTKLVSPIVAVQMTPTGAGYWMFSADGGVFAFGDATFNGSIGGIKLAKPVVSGVAQPDGKGYWMAATDGGVFAFGTSTFQGSAATIPGHKPIVGIERA